MNPLMQLRDHGQSYWLDDLTRQTIASGDLAQRIGSDRERLGISIDFVTTQLENEGIQKFIEAFDSILVQLAKERKRALSSR